MEEVEKAACRPEIWIRLLQHRRTRFYPTFCNRVPLKSKRWRIPSAYYQRMTAGGRYLIEATGNKHQDSTLKLWDLGVPGNAHLLSIPTLLASQVVIGARGDVMVSCCSTSESILVVLTWLLSGDNVQYALFIRSD